MANYKILPTQSGALRYHHENGGVDTVWRDCEIFGHRVAPCPLTEDFPGQVVARSVYYHMDQDAKGRAFPSHSERLFVV